MNGLVVFAALIAVAACSGVDDGRQYTYRGRYNSKCGNDGLYFKDDKSFVFCSNGNSYVQPCAPGTLNSGYNNYKKGSIYNYRDFCDVNLVDDGYGVGAKPGYNKGYNPGYNAGYGYNSGYNTGYGGYKAAPGPY